MQVWIISSENRHEQDAAGGLLRLHAGLLSDFAQPYDAPRKCSEAGTCAVAAIQRRIELASLSQVAAKRDLSRRQELSDRGLLVKRGGKTGSSWEKWCRIATSERLVAKIACEANVVTVARCAFLSRWHPHRCSY